MRKVRWVMALLTLAAAAALIVIGLSANDVIPRSYLPLVRKPPPVVELRGLWVTRFDWTVYGQAAQPGRIDTIVDNAAAAGFNAIFFQVRGTADAFYQPGPEPWAQRVSGGNLGDAPPAGLWGSGDPLSYFVEKAHAKGIQLHAYLNVYPVWDDCDDPPPQTSPEHFYYILEQEHGKSGDRLNGLQWTTSYQESCAGYRRATPASFPADEHYLEVARYLVENYEIDGLHLDHIRYGGKTTSCDPVSATWATVECFSGNVPGYGTYEDFQRKQVNGTVARFYNDIILNYPGLWLSAAVWPIYQDYWGWGSSQGFHDYYQDSKAWIQGGTIDANMPMIYPSISYPSCMESSGFWTQEKWQMLVADFHGSSNGRFIFPGIGTNYCDFAEIAARIEMARQIGTAGHALFSYGALESRDYFDDLAAGPYAEKAIVPEVTWHP